MIEHNYRYANKRRNMLGKPPKRDSAESKANAKKMEKIDALVMMYVPRDIATVMVSHGYSTIEQATNHINALTGDVGKTSEEIEDEMDAKCRKMGLGGDA